VPDYLLRRFFFELDGSKIAPGNRPGPKRVPNDHAVAVSIEATPDGAHPDHDQDRRQGQKEWQPPPSMARWLRCAGIEADCNAPRRAGQPQRQPYAAESAAHLQGVETGLLGGRSKGSWDISSPSIRWLRSWPKDQTTGSMWPDRYPGLVN
jgi:hypothetical protein